MAVERRLEYLQEIGAHGCTDELTSLLKEFRKIDLKFSIPFTSKLRKVADACLKGGHKSRARMLNALAREFEVRHEND
jgi:hypothetical protein